MKPEEFNLLTEDQKISVLWRRAKIVAERKLNNYNVFLYQVDSFYIEVWYSFNLMNIHNIRSFTDTAELQPYLERIIIPAIPGII